MRSADENLNSLLDTIEHKKTLLEAIKAYDFPLLVKGEIFSNYPLVRVALK